MSSSFNQISNHIKEGTWNDFREGVKKVNLELYDIIEQISPGSKYKLLEVEYLYGDKITELGTICLPDKNKKLIPLNSSATPLALKQQLDYCPTPLILQLTKACEVFVEAGDRIIPLNIFHPGDLYGLFEASMPLTNCPAYPCWSVTAGARSVFMGAKVTDVIRHKKLRVEYGISINPPKKLSEQWDIIKTISRKEKLPWSCKVLVFTKGWFKENDNIGWLKFHNYLLKASWIQSKYIRSKNELTHIWETYTSAIKERNLKPSPYLLDTIMHNIFLANGAIPGFNVADENELLIPSRIVEKAYQEIYGLKEYAAIIMQPEKLGQLKENYNIYYSLNYPTVLGGSPSTRRPGSIISELRDLKLLMTICVKIFESYGEHANSLLKNASFEYFHTEEDKFKEIKLSNDIPDTDENIKRCMQRFKGKIFPYQGPFFRGCIKISRTDV